MPAAEKRHPTTSRLPRRRSVRASVTHHKCPRLAHSLLPCPRCAASWPDRHAPPLIRHCLIPTHPDAAGRTCSIAAAPPVVLPMRGRARAYPPGQSAQVHKLDGPYGTKLYKSSTNCENRSPPRCTWPLSWPRIVNQCKRTTACARSVSVLVSLIQPAICPPLRSLALSPRLHSIAHPSTFPACVIPRRPIWLQRGP